jgi:phosphoglycerate dehydrogenase-like enzyme
MKALFLGNVAADTANGIMAELPPGLRVEILADPQRLMQSPGAAADADILVSNHWRAEYPPAPRLRLVQSVATGIELIDLEALPRGVAICNAFGHETAIAEYVLMTMLVWSHRFREIEADFRTRSSWRASWVESGAPHGEIFGSTIGIVGLGRVGQEVARRAAAFGCHVIAANRSPRRAEGSVEQVYPLSELDRMLPVCDFVVLSTALGPETENPNAAEPERRPSRHPFHELPNVIMTPHCSGWTEGMVARRWAEVAGNINRFVRGEPLENVVVRT